MYREQTKRLLHVGLGSTKIEKSTFVHLFVSKNRSQEKHIKSLPRHTIFKRRHPILLKLIKIVTYMVTQIFYGSSPTVNIKQFLVFKLLASYFPNKSIQFIRQFEANLKSTTHFANLRLVVEPTIMDFHNPYCITWVNTCAGAPLPWAEKREYSIMKNNFSAYPLLSLILPYHVTKLKIKSRKTSRVQFSTVCKLILIPSRTEISKYSSHLWWTKEELGNTISEAAAELNDSLNQRSSSCLELYSAMNLLYRPCIEITGMKPLFFL